MPEVVALSPPTTAAWTTIGPKPSGDTSGATDAAALQLAINNLAQGATLQLWAGFYYVNVALTFPQQMLLQGVGGLPLFKSITNGGDLANPNTPFLGGTIIEQVTAATDILDMLTSGVGVDLRDFGLLFKSGLASTGHGINASPSQIYGSGHDGGLVDFHWDRIAVVGHDGNHYGFVLLNPLYGSIDHCHSFGGGGYQIVCDVGSINAGNLIINHPYVNIKNAGSADGYQLSSAVSTGVPGLLNLIKVVRPQCNISSGSTTQKAWNDLSGAGVPRQITIDTPDWEGLANTGQLAIGSGTSIIGAPFTGTDVPKVTRGIGIGNAAGGATPNTEGQWVAVGYQALQNPTGTQNVAIGFQALQGAAAGSSAANNVALGATALKGVTTAASNVGVGYAALQQLTTGSNNTVLGRDAGNFTNGSAANGIVTGQSNTFVGYQCGSTSGDISAATAIGFQSLVAQNATALGYGTHAQGAGSVAIGIDHSGGSASTAVQDTIVFGTALHHTLLGVSAPALTVTAGLPYMPSTAGTPTGVPAGPAGWVAFRYDSTAHKLWIYDAGWKGVVVA